MAAAGRHTEGVRSPRCKAPNLARELNQAGLLARKYPSAIEREEWPITMLTDRDRDRVRLYRRIATEPDGISLPGLVAQTLKGVRAKDRAQLVLEGSDADYQFTRRFLDSLRAEGHVKTLATGENGARVARPTPAMLDLISAGKRETGENQDPRDRKYAEKLLRSCSRLSEGRKEWLREAFDRYCDRTQDYRLLFEANFLRSDGPPRKFTKEYKTRFTHRDRYARSFARLQDALEEGYENAESAVLVTLTTDPAEHDSLADAIEAIGPNFHRLNQYMASDPSTKADTRRDDVPTWRPDLDGSVTGRPRESLDYVKVLEFTERGYPHLHVLYFDPPRRESDGCPWLIDKAELSKKWDDYGQGRIVDVYPLTYRDDLDELEGSEFNSSEGFVCWYRYGEHSHGAEWAESRSRSHDLVDMDGDSDQAQQKTAGAYLGKYLGHLFAGLGLGEAEDHEKAARWKLALYWATRRQFWSISRSLHEAIRRDDGLEPDVRAAIRWCIREDLHAAIARTPPGEAVEAGLAELDRDDQALHDAAAISPVTVTYVGTYRYSDLPAPTATAPAMDKLEAAAASPSSGVVLRPSRDRPPPLTGV